VALLLAISLHGAGVARAQATQETQQTAVLQKPDIQVVVAPLSMGTWGISEVYPSAVDHTLVQSRMQALGQAAGWKIATESLVRDQSLSPKRRDKKPLDRAGEDADIPGDKVMSSISGSTTDKIVDVTGGSMNIVPFLVSLRDLSHVNIVYLVPPAMSFPFHGLRHYEDSHVAIDLAVRQGTYLYTVNIKDHGLTSDMLSGLPQYQDANAPTAAPVTDDRSHIGVYTTGLVIGLAIGAGLLVFLWAMKLGGGSRRDGRG